MGRFPRISAETILWGVLLLCGGMVWADPEVKAVLKPAKTITVGRTCQLEISARWKSEEAEFRFQEPRYALEGFTVENGGEESRSFLKGGQEWKEKLFRYGIKAVKPGVGRVHSFRISYVDPKTQTGEFVEIPSLSVKIVPDHSGLIRFLLMGLGAASLIIVGVVGIRKGFFQPKRTLDQQLSDVFLEEKCLSQVNSILEVENDLTGERIFELAGIFSQYLTKKFALGKGRLTTLELLEQIEGKISPDELKNLRQIFSRLDEARFSDEGRSLATQSYLAKEIFRYIEGKKVISVSRTFVDY